MHIGNLNQRIILIIIIIFIGSILINGCEKNKLVYVVEDITAFEAYTLIQNNKDCPCFVILDVRTPEEFANKHIEMAINLDYYSETFEDDLNSLNKRKTYLVYCESGGRSASTSNMMKDMDFYKVYNLIGGITAWEEAGYETVQG